MNGCRPDVTALERLACLVDSLEVQDCFRSDLFISLCGAYKSNPAVVAVQFAMDLMLLFAVIAFAASSGVQEARRPACSLTFLSCFCDVPRGSANSKCFQLGLGGDCCPTPQGRLLDCCAGSEAWLRSSPAADGRQLSRQYRPFRPQICHHRLPMPRKRAPLDQTAVHTFRRLRASKSRTAWPSFKAKNLKSPADLAARLKRCTPGFSPYRPNPKPDIPGATAWHSVITKNIREDKTGGHHRPAMPATRRIQRRGPSLDLG